MGAAGSGRKCKPGEINRHTADKLKAKAKAKAVAEIRAITGISFSFEEPDLDDEIVPGLKFRDIPRFVFISWYLIQFRKHGPTGTYLGICARNARNSKKSSRDKS